MCREKCAPPASACPLIGSALPLLLVLLLFLTQGCASRGPYRLFLMPAPEVYEADGLNPFQDPGKIEKDTRIEVLYATDRKPVAGSDAKGFYENDRGYLLRLGVGTVRLGEEGTTWDDLKRVSLLKNRTEDFPLQVTAAEEFGILDRTFSRFDSPEMLRKKSSAAGRRFAAAVEERLKRSSKKDIVVYVPGFKVNFENPLLVTAELWHYLGYDGAFVAFAWPSTPSVWAYVSDAETAALSSRTLRIFLQYLAACTSARRIHVLGYSAGSRLITRAFYDLALIHASDDDAAIRKALRIGQVILVGSDVDRDIFAGMLLDGILRIPEHFTVYMSTADSALSMSSWVLNRQRLGQLTKGQTVKTHINELLRSIPNLSLIDVSEAEEAFSGNGHAYFRKSPWASSDVLATLRLDLSPDQRGLTRSKDSPIWTFPPDYISRLKTAISGAGQGAY